uniref:Uncharacterized protein n=1 Tax=Anopheles atroparvus TaxID=41427 RepID=A0A182J7R4_ANOAO
MTAGGITKIPTSQSATARLITKQLVTVRRRRVVTTDSITSVLPTTVITISRQKSATRTSFFHVRQGLVQPNRCGPSVTAAPSVGPVRPSSQQALLCPSKGAVSARPSNWCTKESGAVERFRFQPDRTGSCIGTGATDGAAVPAGACSATGASFFIGTFTSAAGADGSNGGGCETVIGSEMAIEVGLTDEATDDFERGKSSSSSSDSLIELGSSFVSANFEMRGSWNGFPPSRTFCVTVNVLPVSRGTVQLTGSGERMMICSGDLTRVGSGGDLIICSRISGGGATVGPTAGTGSLSASSTSTHSQRCPVEGERESQNV